MFLDPLYILFLAPAFIFTVWAQKRVQDTYEKYSKILAVAGMPGYRAAAHLLNSVGMPEIELGSVPGDLTDRYDPSKKVLRLSEGVYKERSLPALAIVAQGWLHANYADSDLQA